MEIKRIIIATGNQGKVKEYKEMLGDLKVPIYSLKDLNIKSDPIEDGETFVENALIKARDIDLEDGDIVIGDDAGLEIDYLGGRPGVYTARYLGKDTNHDIKMAGILDEMKNAGEDERGARFKCAIALKMSDGTEFVAEGTMEGRIATKRSGTSGFGYDPIFIIDKYGKTAADVGAELKNAVSHRGQALRQVQEFLKKI